MGLPQLRWWDSIGWTQDVAEARQPMVMRETAERRFAWADDEMPTRRSRREQRRREREQEDHAGMDKWRPTAETLLQLEPPKTWSPNSAERSDDRVFTMEPEQGARDQRAQAAPDASAPNARRESGASDTGFPIGASAEDFSRFFEWGPELEPEQAFAAFPAEPAAAFSTGLTPRRPTAPAPSRTPAPSMQAAQPMPAAAAEPIPAPPTPSLVSTGPVWIIALLPLAQLALSLLVAAGFGWGASTSLLAAIWILPYPIVLVLALCDRWALQSAGYHRPALWAWALLSTPVYLFMRAVRTTRESGRGFTPLITWTLLAALQVGSVVAVPGLAVSALPELFRAQAEQSIASDASVLGTHLTVHCPAALPSHVGDEFTCTMTKNSGTHYPVTVSLQRLNGWIDWHIENWGVPFLDEK
ncbi:hypothetical protein GCM10027052_03780 [Parafrigoribacterium mesophilum]